MSTVTTPTTQAPRRPDPLHAAVPVRRGSDLAVRLIALAVFALGLLNLWSSLLARGPGRAQFLLYTVHLPLVVQHNSRTLIALFGLALLTLARSLARHKRQAWWIALLLAVISPLPHLAKGLDYEEAIYCLLLAIVLLLFRHAFYAGNDRLSARQGMRTAIVLFVLSVIYGPIGYFLLREKFYPTFTWTRAVYQTTHQIIFYPPVRALVPMNNSPRARWFDSSLQTVAVITMAYGLFMLLRPTLPRERHGEADRRRARQMLIAYGGDPLSYFTLLHDKRYLFDEERGEWAVAYVVVGRVAAVLGDPLGDPSRVGDAIDAFTALCRSHDWQPAFYQVPGRHLERYRATSAIRLRALKIGEDALLDLGTWSMKGKAFQDLRTAINKMGRTGIVFEAFERATSSTDTDATLNAPPVSTASSADTLTQMAAISEEWLRQHKGEEKTFALGRFDPEGETLRDSRIFLARETATDRVLAFVTFVPIFGKGWGLDLMRRRSDAPNGLMEFLIASSALRFQSEGAELLSLGLSPLAGGGEPEAGESEIMARGRQLLYERFNLFYGFKGLHAFKEKFGPRWEPRYLIYPGDAALATTVYSIIRAHSPRGLWTFLWR